MDEQTETPPLALRVTGGGEPTAQELAALLVTLTPTSSDETGAARGPAAWTRAALIEGVGGRPPTSLADVEVTFRRG